MLVNVPIFIAVVGNGVRWKAIQRKYASCHCSLLKLLAVSGFEGNFLELKIEAAIADFYF